MLQDVTSDGGSVFFAMVFILTVCAALITINGNSCYFIVNFLRPSGSSKLFLYCWCMLLCCAEWHMCVSCRLIVYFMGGQLVFDWDRLEVEDFLITRDRSVGNKVTNTIPYAKVEYQNMYKYSAPLPLMHTEGKVSVTPESQLSRNSLPS